MILPKKTAKVDQNPPLPTVAPICTLPLEEPSEAPRCASGARWPNTTSKSQSAQSASPGREGTLSSPNPVTPQWGNLARQF